MLLNFDYDGVIVDSLDQLVQVAIQAQTGIGSGRTPSRRDFAVVENLTVEEVGREIGIPEVELSRYVELFFEAQRKDTSKASLYEGIFSTFKELAKKHTIVVITSSQSNAVRSALVEHGLELYIADVLGGDVGNRKSDRIQMMQSKFKIPSESTFMIGDAVSDIREGKIAGVKTVAVTWGFQHLETLAKEEPDFIVDTPSDLLELFNYFS